MTICLDKKYGCIILNANHLHLYMKHTKGRDIVLNIIKQAINPLTAKEIVKSVKGKIDQATVYRILKKFEEEELIFADELDGEKRYYIAKEKHHHIICQICKKIKCIPCSHKITRVSGFTNINHSMFLTGICNNCNKKI